MTFYERRLARMNEEAERDGVTVAEWRKWERLTDNLVKSCRFKDSAEVNRVAQKFGKFID